LAGLVDPQSFYTLLSEIFLMLDDGDRRLLNRFNLTSARYFALLHIGDGPGMSLSELSRMMLCDKSNATRVIKGMEAEELVYRLPHETDGRTLRLYLSQKGEQLRREVLSKHQRFNEKRFGNIEQNEREMLYETLRHLKHDLRDQLSETGAA